MIQNNPLGGISPEVRTQKGINTHMIISLLFTIANRWK